MPTAIRLAYKVVFDAIWHFSEDDGWAMASHVALSTLLAIFPFLIFGTALGSFLGADQFAETRGDGVVDPLVRVGASRPGENADRRAPSGLRTPHRSGHHLAEPAGDDLAAPLGQ